MLIAPTITAHVVYELKILNKLLYKNEWNISREKCGSEDRGKRKPSRQDRAGPPENEKFTGRTKSLEDAIYNGIYNQSDLSMQTTKKLANYAGRKLRESQDIKLGIETVRDIPIQRPSLVPTMIIDVDYPTTEETELLTTIVWSLAERSIHT